MAKPIKRAIPGNARKHINDARRLRQEANAHRQNALHISQQITKHARPIFANRPSRQVVSSSVIGMGRKLAQAESELGMAFKKREKARTAIANAKKRVLRANRSKRAQRGRLYRHIGIFGFPE